MFRKYITIGMNKEKYKHLQQKDVQS